MDQLPGFVTRQDGRFIAGWCAGEVWLLDIRPRTRNPEEKVPRVKVCDTKKVGLADSSISVSSCLGRFVFVGQKSSRKEPLRVFSVCTTTGEEGERHSRLDVAAVPFQSDSKQRGLGALFATHSDKGQADILLACGHGIGTGHIWQLRLQDGLREDERMQYRGKVNVIGNTILAMVFTSGGRFLVTLTNENVAQKWNIRNSINSTDELTAFDLKSKDAVRFSADRDNLTSCFDGDSEMADSLLSRYENAKRLHNVNLWVKSVQQMDACWGELFPPRVLDPFAYDGDVDSDGKPHGRGTKLYKNDPNKRYVGEWVHGMQNGRGTLLDTRSSTELYVGAWSNGQANGFGCEILPSSGEIYTGFFRNGKRHGIGTIIASNRDSLLDSSNSEEERRVRTTGFFLNGECNGLSWTTFPKDCPAVPFAVSSGSIQHLLPIRCITQYDQGEFFREFGYHRVDGVPLSKLDRDLFNFKESKKAKCFSFHNDGHWDHPECWACLETDFVLSETNESTFDNPNRMLTCQNPRCQMRVHEACLGQSEAMRRYLWDDLIAIYCNENETLPNDSFKKKPDRSFWVCPMDSCQEIGRHMLNEEYSEDFRDAKIDSKIAAKSFKQKSNRKSVKRAHREQKLRNTNASIDIPAILKCCTSENSDNYCSLSEYSQDPHELFSYYDRHGYRRLVVSDEDLKEALEEAYLCSLSTLTLYRSNLRFP